MSNSVEQHKFSDDTTITAGNQRVQRMKLTPQSAKIPVLMVWPLFFDALFDPDR